MKTSIRKRLRFAFTAADTAAWIRNAVLASIVLLVIPVFAGESYIMATGIPAVLALCGVLVLGTMNFLDYSSVFERHLTAAAHQWVRQAQNRKEALRRQALLNQVGPAGLMSMSDSPLMYNPDTGLPMNGSVDSSGRVIGQSLDGIGGFDVGNGSMLDTSDAYSSPFGMNDN